MRGLTLPAFLYSAAFILAQFASAQCTPHWLQGQSIPGLNGVPYCTVLWDPDGPGPLAPRIVVGGKFSVAGPITVNNIALIDPDTGQWSTLGSGLDNRVNTLAVLPNGDLIAAGLFSNAGGSPANYIAKWNGAAWSPLGGGVNLEVLTLAVLANGELVAGGNFVVAQGSPANYIAKWNGTTWSPLGTGLGGPASALTVTPSGSLIAGGSFTTAGGNPALRIARWDGSSWSALASGLNNSVFALAARGSDIFAGGFFTTAGGTSANRIARWNGSSWSALSSGANGTVRTFSFAPNNDILIGGDFTTVGGVLTGNTARWNGSAWAAIASDTIVGADVSSRTASLLSLSDGRVFSAGTYSFSNPAGGSNICGYVAALSGNAWTALSPGLSTGISTFTQDSTGLIAGGEFKFTNGTRTNGVARWNGLSWQPLGHSFLSYPHIRSLAALPDGTIAAANAELTFSNVVSYNGGVWNVLGSFNDNVYALLVRRNGRLVAAGNFSIADSTNATRIAEWDGIQWHALGSGISTAVYSIAEYPNGNLVIGAAGNTISNIPDIIQVWDGTSWTTIGQNVGATVYALAIRPEDQTLFAGGDFGSIGSVTASRVAYYRNGAWHPMGSGLTGSPGIAAAVGAYSILLQGPTDVVVAGYFNAAGGNPVSNLARWNGSTWSAIGTSINGPIFALAQINDEIAIGGSFTATDAGVSGFFARWTDTGAPAIAVHQPDLTADVNTTVVLSTTPASGYDNVSYQWKKNALPIENANGMFAHTNGVAATLTIQNAQFSDAADFTCTFSNSCGESTTHPAHLSIYCPSDFNHDDVVDFFDYLDFVNAFSIYNPIADFNHDEVLDFFDYLDFVNAFSSSC